ncbi:MAG: hypothetical protein AB9891_18695 [Anaerolineaceae bacterium]
MVPVIPVMALLIAIGINSLVEAFLFLLGHYCQTVLRPIIVSIAGLMVIAAGLFQYFSIIPGIFKPDLDQVMNWAELSNHDNVPFIYITNRENWEKWKPFMLGRMTPDKPFQVISEDDYLEGTDIISVKNEVVIIFHNNFYFEILEKLNHGLTLPLKPIPIRDSDGKPIGNILVIGSFVLPSHPLSIQESVIQLLASPAGMISLFLFMIALILNILPKIKSKVE